MSQKTVHHVLIKFTRRLPFSFLEVVPDSREHYEHFINREDETGWPLSYTEKTRDVKILELNRGQEC